MGGGGMVSGYHRHGRFVLQGTPRKVFGVKDCCEKARQYEANAKLGGTLPAQLARERNKLNGDPPPRETE